MALLCWFQTSDLPLQSKWQVLAFCRPRTPLLQVQVAGCGLPLGLSPADRWQELVPSNQIWLPVKQTVRNLFVTIYPKMSIEEATAKGNFELVKYMVQHQWPMPENLPALAWPHKDLFMWLMKHHFEKSWLTRAEVYEAIRSGASVETIEMILGNIGADQSDDEDFVLGNILCFSGLLVLAVASNNFAVATYIWENCIKNIPLIWGQILHYFSRAPISIPQLEWLLERQQPSEADLYWLVSPLIRCQQNTSDVTQWLIDYFNPTPDVWSQLAICAAKNNNLDQLKFIEQRNPLSEWSSYAFRHLRIFEFYCVKCAARFPDGQLFRLSLPLAKIFCRYFQITSRQRTVLAQLKKWDILTYLDTL